MSRWPTTDSNSGSRRVKGGGNSQDAPAKAPRHTTGPSHKGAQERPSKGKKQKTQKGKVGETQKGKVGVRTVRPRQASGQGRGLVRVRAGCHVALTHRSDTIANTQGVRDSKGCGALSPSSPPRPPGPALRRPHAAHAPPPPCPPYPSRGLCRAGVGTAARVARAWSRGASGKAQHARKAQGATQDDSMKKNGRAVLALSSWDRETHTHWKRSTGLPKQTRGGVHALHFYEHCTHARARVCRYTNKHGSIRGQQLGGKRG